MFSASSHHYDSMYATLRAGIQEAFEKNLLSAQEFVQNTAAYKRNLKFVKFFSVRWGIVLKCAARVHSLFIPLVSHFQTLLNQEEQLPQRERRKVTKLLNLMFQEQLSLALMADVYPAFLLMMKVFQTTSEPSSFRV